MKPMKPTIIIYDLFYLKLIIFRDIIYLSIYIL